MVTSLSGLTQCCCIMTKNVKFTLPHLAYQESLSRHHISILYQYAWQVNTEQRTDPLDKVWLCGECNFTSMTRAYMCWYSSMRSHWCVRTCNWGPALTTEYAHCYSLDCPGRINESLKFGIARACMAMRSRIQSHDHKTSSDLQHQFMSAPTRLPQVRGRYLGLIWYKTHHGKFLS